MLACTAKCGTNDSTGCPNGPLSRVREFFGWLAWLVLCCVVCLEAHKPDRSKNSSTLMVYRCKKRDRAALPHEFLPDWLLI